MFYETITLTTPFGSVKLTAYAPANSPEIEPGRVRPAVVMCPGGGYGFRSDREAEPVALQLLARDICVFLLEYHVAPARYPAAVTELAAAVAWVREHASQYHVQPDRIAVMGYSAGGHLAASLGVRWHEPWLSESLGKTPAQIRPDSMVLCYPVITGGSFTHEGSMENLLGTKDKALWTAQSLEDLVTDKTVPAFLWHTYEDTAVPVENSLFFFTAMRRCGVPGELHIYPKGVHGLSLCSALTCDPAQAPHLLQPDAAGWIDLAARWIRSV